MKWITRATFSGVGWSGWWVFFFRLALIEARLICLPLSGYSLNAGSAGIRIPLAELANFADNKKPFSTQHKCERQRRITCDEADKFYQTRYSKIIGDVKTENDLKLAFNVKFIDLFGTLISDSGVLSNPIVVGADTLENTWWSSDAAAWRDSPRNNSDNNLIGRGSLHNWAAWVAAACWESTS